MKNLRILLYNGNPASVMNSLAIGLKQKKCDVRGLAFFSNTYINYSEIEILAPYPKKGLWKKLEWKVFFYSKISKAIYWADVVHVFWDSNLYVIVLSWLLRKTRVVTFVGSDIRIPEVSFQYNPYYKLAYQNAKYEYKDLESKAISTARQRRFCRFGFKVIVWDTFHYINDVICKKVFIVPHASINSTPVAPKESKEILIVHAPTAPVAKGSHFVIETMQRIQNKFPMVKFQVLSGITNEEYQQSIAQSDIFVDQFVWGAYGVATQQALEMGKIVVCYLNENIAKKIFPSDIPVQNATIETLEEKLSDLIINRHLWDELSQRSKKYYQDTHSPEVVAEKVLEVYRAK